MPVYEYECQKCGDVLEVSQRISDDPLKDCPRCAGSLKKIISATAFHLKGGGWYADGYSAARGGGGAGVTAAKSDTASSPDVNTPPCKKEGGEKPAACAGCSAA